MATIVTRQLRPDLDSGTTDGTTANKLVDSGQNFTTSMAGATLPCVVRNTTDTTRALVTAIDSDTTLSLDADIMVSGEAYVIGGDYETAAAWKADFGGTGDADWDLVVNDKAVIMEAYKGDYTGIGDGGSLNRINEVIFLQNVDGFNCDATHNVKWVVPISDRHNGRPGTGLIWDGDTNQNFTIEFETSLTYSEIEGLEVYNNNTINPIGSVLQAADEGKIRFCLCHLTVLRGRRAHIYSCVIWSETPVGSEHRPRCVTYKDSAGGTTENCVFADAEVGHQHHQLPYAIDDLVRNCVSWNVDEFYDDILTGWNANTGYNASSTYTTQAPPDEVGGTNYTSNVVASDFIDAANGDFRLSPTSNLKGMGLDLTGLGAQADGREDFTKDVANETWPNGSPWDIGAHFLILLGYLSANAIPIDDNTKTGFVYNAGPGTITDS